MSQHFRFDASRSLAALKQDSTIVAVIEMSQTKWWSRRSFLASNANL
jgi:transposase